MTNSKNPRPYSEFDDEQLLRTEEVAEWLGVSASWLNKARMEIGSGPTFTKVGTSVRYRVGAVKEWITENQRRSVRVAYTTGIALTDSSDQVNDANFTSADVLQWLGVEE